MDGAELSKPEFAYLLATVHAPGIVGVEDPQLFPAKKAARQSTFSKGRKQLETNGWITPVPEHPEEYDLNPALLQMVAVVAEPNFVLATSRGTEDSDRSLVLHYLASDLIVELWAPSKKSYVVAVVPDQDSLQGRMAEMLQLGDSGEEAQFTLDESTFNKLQSLSQKGKLGQAQDLLGPIGLDSEAGGSLLSALSRPPTGEVVVVHASAGEIDSGRRASIYGEAQSAWRVSRTEAEGEDLEIAAFDTAGAGALVANWIEELTEEQ